ncbi:hypothetical protein C8R31_101532 [Nitrosospira sp. Nsp2]|nr:hypothetical protein C8R31_101532 [Nitrosospira sp. Nsp2]
MTAFHHGLQHTVSKHTASINHDWSFHHSVEEHTFPKLLATNLLLPYAIQQRPARPPAPAGSLEIQATRQCLAPPIASCNVLITSSRLNAAGFWRGGYFTKFSICCATNPCIS